VSEFHCDCSIDPYDYEAADVCREETLTARKEHVCSECGSTIPPGDQYERVTGMWDGYWSTYKTCLTCVRIRRDYCPSGWIYGELRSHLWECMGLDYVSGAVASWIEEEEENDLRERKRTTRIVEVPR